jgi:toxin ParE1/3/4
MTVARWTSQAERDFEQIALYVGVTEYRPSAADRLIDLIMDTVELLAQHNTMGTARDDLGLGYRVFSVSRYVVVFKATPDGIEVARIVDGRRDLSALFQ